MNGFPPLAQVRPRDRVFYVSSSRTVLATARDGFIHGQGEEGLYVFQTRLLSLYRYTIDGKAPQPAGISNVEEHSQIAYYVVESPTADQEMMRGALGPGGRAATEAIELRLARFAGDGLQEEVALTNHTQKAAELRLELEIDADFADPQETHGARRQKGHIARHWRAEDAEAELSWSYAAEHEYDHQGNRGTARLRRGVSVTIRQTGAEVRYSRRRKRIRFQVKLEPHGIWRASISVAAIIDGRVYQPAERTDFRSRAPFEKERERFLRHATEIDIGTQRLAMVVQQTMERARRDLVGLRLFDLDTGDGWVPAAGLPVYIAVFGRDTLVTSWLASLVDTGMARGALARLAETQAAGTDDWLDEQPGKFVHQMETGPLAELRFNPHKRYYGSLTGPGMYPIVLSDLWHWTGDGALVRRFLAPALRGLEWLEREARRGHFYAYQTRSEQGVKNQAWKDSYDAIVYPDGRQVKDPIAPTEFQAYVYAAKVRLSEMLWWLDEKDTARKLFAEAAELRKRFNEVFWMEDEGCFGMGLDPEDELIRSVGSESAHALAAGIVPEERAGRVVERLFRSDMFSGWGLRTLSAAHVAFNPFSYHRGSVWPLEQAIFCIGLMRYRQWERLQQVAEAQFEAAALFEYWRLPEVFAGHPRDDGHPVPALYPNADSPQAWSAAAVPCMIQAMLGVTPYAPLQALVVDPHLPEWLPEITLRQVRVGDAEADLRFRRLADGNSDYDVLDIRGKLRVLRQPEGWRQGESLGEEMAEILGRS